MELYNTEDIKKAKELYEKSLNGVYTIELYDKASDSLNSVHICQNENQAEEMIMAGKDLPELTEGNSYRVFKTKYDNNAEIIEHSLVKEYTKDDIENVAKVKRNPLLERLDKVRQQEEYAKQLQKETENKEFNLVYDKVKEILPRAKELHELRKEFNYPQTAMNPFYEEYPEFRPYADCHRARGDKADADCLIWVNKGIGVKPFNDYEHYVCVNYYDGTISVRLDSEKSNEPMSKYKQEWVNMQLSKIVESFDSFYQCEYAKLEYELKMRSQGSDAIIEKYKDKDQELDKIKNGNEETADLLQAIEYSFDYNDVTVEFENIILYITRTEQDEAMVDYYINDRETGCMEDSGTWFDDCNFTADLKRAVKSVMKEKDISEQILSVNNGDRFEEIAGISPVRQRGGQSM